MKEETNHTSVLAFLSLLTHSDISKQTRAYHMDTAMHPSHTHSIPVIIDPFPSKSEQNNPNFLRLLLVMHLIKQQEN